MKKYFWIILGILSLLSWLYFFFALWSSRKQPDSHTDQHAIVIADHDTLQSHGVDYRRTIDSLSIDNYRLDSANKSLQQGQAIYRKQLDLKTAEAKTLATQVKAANKDTSLNVKIDSLVNEVNNMAFLLAQYEAYADSINNVNDSLKINHDAIMMEKDKRIAELQATYDSLFIDYQQLFADSRVLAKDLKKQKLKTKIAAVLGGAAAVLGLIK